MFDLTVLGEVMLRFSAAENDRLQNSALLRRDAAGSELNVAAALAQLGCRTALCTKLPDHALARYILDKARSMKVDTTPVVTDTSPNARLGIYYFEGASAPRKPSVVYDRKNSSVNSLLESEIDPSLYENTRIFHTCGITLALGGHPRETAITMMKKMKDAGALISFDINYRAALWTDQEERAVVEPLLPLVDILFISEESFRKMFHQTGTLPEMMKRFAETYQLRYVASSERQANSPAHHRFTCNVYDAENDTYYRELPYEIDVVDRVGSGDAFVAGALYGFLNNSAKQAAAYGAALAALKCTIQGDLLTTTPAEVSRLIEQHYSDNQSEMDR